MPELGFSFPAHPGPSPDRQQQELQELVQEVKDARVEVEAANTRMHQASAKLRQAVRRTESDDLTAKILMFANAYMRMTGVITSGLRRVVIMDRLLGNAEDEQRERQDAEDRMVEVRERQEVRRQRAKSTRLTLPEPEDAFDEIYGEVI